MNLFFSALENCINTLIWNIANVSSCDSKLTTLLCASARKHQFLLDIIFNKYKNSFIILVYFFYSYYYI